MGAWAWARMCQSSDCVGRVSSPFFLREEEHRLGWLSPEPVLRVPASTSRPGTHGTGGGCWGGARRVLAPTTSSPPLARPPARAHISPVFSTVGSQLPAAAPPVPRGAPPAREIPGEGGKGKCGEGKGDAQRKHSVPGLMARSGRLWSRSGSPSEELRVRPCARSCGRAQEERQESGTWLEEKQSCSCRLPLPSAFGFLRGTDFVGAICSCQREKGGSVQEVGRWDRGLPPGKGGGRTAFERFCTGSRGHGLERPLRGRGGELYGTILGLNKKKKKKRKGLHKDDCKTITCSICDQPKTGRVTGAGGGSGSGSRALAGCCAQGAAGTGEQRERGAKGLRQGDLAAPAPGPSPSLFQLQNFP